MKNHPKPIEIDLGRFISVRRRTSSFHKPPILIVAIEGACEAVGEGHYIASSGEKRINVARSVRDREKVIDPPHINRTTLCAREILISVVGSLS